MVENGVNIGIVTKVSEWLEQKNRVKKIEIQSNNEHDLSKAM